MASTRATPLDEPELHLGAEPGVLVPDLADWRRDRAELPGRDALVPDWICEVLSTANPTNDTVRKKRIYHRFQVPHYWIVDPRDETLSVYRYTPEGYLEVLAAQRAERVRAEPFTSMELPVSALFGDEEE